MSSPREEILAAGLDDWVSLSQAENGVKDSLPELNKDDLRRATIDTIERMLNEDLLEVGQLAPRFEPWTASSAESIAILRGEWTVTNASRDHGFDWWLRLTAAGKQLARAVDSRRDES